MKQIDHVGGLAVSTFTDARLRVDESIQIETSSADIWDVIVDQSVAAGWLPSVKKMKSIDSDASNTDGVGFVRTVVYGSGDEIKESVVYAEHHKILAYQIAFPSMVKDHLSVIEITKRTANLSTVRLYGYFTPTQLTGKLMAYGVYSRIVKSSLKKLRTLCIADRT